MTRNILLDVTKNDEDNKLYAELSFVYKYVFTYTDLAGNSRVGTYETTVTDVSLFANGVAVDSNPSIYIFYCPDYDNPNAENIRINNYDNLSFTLDLIKQETTGYEIYESTYQALIELHQNGNPDPGATVVSNAGIHLADGTELPGVFFWRWESQFHYREPELAAVLAVQNPRNRMYALSIALYEEGSDYDPDSHIYTLTAAKLQ